MISNYLKNILNPPGNPSNITDVGPRDSTLGSSDISPSPHQAVDSGGEEAEDTVARQPFVFVRDDEFARQTSGTSVRIKHLRHMTDLSASSVCVALQVSNSAYSNYETGVSRPSIKIGMRIAAYHRVTLDYVYLGRVKGLSQRVRKKIHDYADEHAELKQNII